MIAALLLAVIPPAPHTEHIDAIVDQGLCVEWALTAVAAGWPIEDVPQVLRIMYRESRCQPDACPAPAQPQYRQCRDWGLMQINDHSWKTTIRSQGLRIEDMHNPYHNLRFARWLYDTALAATGDGWEPWDMAHALPNSNKPAR